MSKYDLVALIATSPVNISYFTGFDCWQYRSFRENMSLPGAPVNLKQAYAVVTPDSKISLIADTFTAPFASPAEAELRTYGNIHVTLPQEKSRESAYLTSFRAAVFAQKATAADALTSTLEDRGIRKGKVGIELANVSERTRKELDRNFPDVQFLDAAELIRFIRMIKTKGEVERLRMAAEINEIALKKSLSIAKGGIKSGALIRAYLSEVAKRGAMMEHYIFSFGGIGITDHERISLRRGGFSMVDCGCVYKSYYADTGTTLIIGQPRDEVSKKHKKLWDVIEESLGAIRPGATPSFILATFAKAFEREGIRGVEYQGHGIGLETREHPVIAYSDYKRISDEVMSESTDAPLEEGMTINIETPIYEAGRGAWQVERTFLIGKRSVREITPKRDGLAFVTS